MPEFYIIFACYIFVVKIETGKLRHSRTIMYNNSATNDYHLLKLPLLTIITYGMLWAKCF